VSERRSFEGGWRGERKNGWMMNGVQHSGDRRTDILNGELEEERESRD